MFLHNYSETPCVLLNWDLYKLAHYMYLAALSVIMSWKQNLLSHECLEHKTCLIQNLFLAFRLIWVRSSSIFMHMTFSKLRNATMTAQSKLYIGEILYNYICAMCYFPPIKPWSINGNFSLSFDRVQAFLNSDQNRCATKLLSAYEEGDAEEIKRIAQSSAFNHLDHVVILFISSIKSNACWIVSAMV